MGSGVWRGFPQRRGVTGVPPCLMGGGTLDPSSLSRLCLGVPFLAPRLPPKEGPVWWQTRRARVSESPGEGGLMSLFCPVILWHCGPFTLFPTSALSPAWHLVSVPTLALPLPAPAARGTRTLVWRLYSGGWWGWQSVCPCPLSCSPWTEVVFTAGLSCSSAHILSISCRVDPFGHQSQWHGEAGRMGDRPQATPGLRTTPALHDSLGRLPPASG